VLVVIGTDPLLTSMFSESRREWPCVRLWVACPNTWPVAAGRCVRSAATLRCMDYGFADRGEIRWSDSQSRYVLSIFEGPHVLYTFALADGFEAPDREVMPRWLGIEDINARLAEARLYPTGLGAWKQHGHKAWVCSWTPRRSRTHHDH